MAPPDPKVSSTSPSTDSDTSPSRLERHPRIKFTKHMVERKRRDRINYSLTQMRTLVLEALNKNTDQYSKMEKADILDMTVQYMKRMRTRSGKPSATSTTGSTTYNIGYRACAAEVARHLANTTMSDDMKTGLMTSITHKVASPSAMSYPTQGLGHTADYTATPPGWRGAPAHAYHHAFPSMPSPQYGNSQATSFSVPAAPTTHAQPRDLNMNFIGVQPAYQHAAKPVDNTGCHTQRRSAAEAVPSTTSHEKSSFSHPLQLNLSLNFESQASSLGRLTNISDAKEADDMWRPW